MPGIETGYPPEGDFDKALRAGLPNNGEADTDGGMEDGASLDKRLLTLAEAARTQSVSFAQQNWRGAWDQNYKAFRSEYIAKSKYKSDDYRHRSKIFRPKTRIAVTKDIANAAQTLFSTTDMVTVSPGDEQDPQQVANADLQQALLNYRLDRTSGKNSIAWFLVAMGARQDCQIAGICCSKSYWAFQEREIETQESVRDELTGATSLTPVKRKKKIKDKPEIDLIPPENVGLDPAASWIDPVNSGAYFYAKYPMHVQDVKNMMKDPRTGWRGMVKEDGSDDDTALNAAFTKARVEEFSEVRRSREGGQDRMDNSTSSDNAFDVVWAYEWFIREADEDYCFWTLGTDHMLSDPVTTEEAYPWKGGERPYRIGYGNLEAHRIVPQSPVETVQPLQNEINDITNLGLDNLKQVMEPVAKVLRGKKIDTDALKRRYPVLFVTSKEDVEWDRPPEGASSKYADLAPLNTDFDDLAGTFNGGSVANNRQVGETVGGMKLMAGAANAVSEFYARLWVETWVEPVMSDIAKLEAYYESDEKILALAQKKAPGFKKFGIDAITDELLSQEVLVRVTAGVGAPDPMQKMAKMAQAFALAEKVVAGSKNFASGALQMNEEALLNEIFGYAGQKDAFDRFFIKGQAAPAPGAPPNPDADPAVLADKKAERDSKENIAKIKAKTDITKTLIGHRADQRYQRHDHKQQGKHKFIDVLSDALGRKEENQHRDMDRQVAAQKPPARPAAAP